MMKITARGHETPLRGNGGLQYSLADTFGYYLATWETQQCTFSRIHRNEGEGGGEQGRRRAKGGGGCVCGGVTWGGGEHTLNPGPEP